MEKFKFDVVAQTLTITAKFAEAMNNPESKEYKLVQKFRADFPALVIIGICDFLSLISAHIVSEMNDPKIVTVREFDIPCIFAISPYWSQNRYSAGCPLRIAI